MEYFVEQAGRLFLASPGPCGIIGALTKHFSAHVSHLCVPGSTHSVRVCTYIPARPPASAYCALHSQAIPRNHAIFNIKFPTGHPVAINLTEALDLVGGSWIDPVPCDGSASTRPCARGHRRGHRRGPGFKETNWIQSHSSPNRLRALLKLSLRTPHSASINSMNALGARHVRLQHSTASFPSSSCHSRHCA